MTFLALPQAERAAIVRRMAAEGMTRAEIALDLGVKYYVVDKLCAAGNIRTSGVSRPTPPMHPGWDRDEEDRRAWFIKMGERFGKAMRAEMLA